MAFIESISNPGITQEVDRAFQAARVALRPLDHTAIGKVLGHYRAVGTTSAAAFTNGAHLAALRWTDPLNFLVLLKVRTFITVVTAVTAQRNDPLVLNIARAYTARDATGATALTISGNNQKARSSMSTSLVGNLDVTSAAGGLTGGTKTVDANPHAAIGIGGSGLVGLGTNGGGEFFNAENNYLHPIVLANNEGALVTWGPTTLATGTVTATVEFAWAEVIVF